MSDQTPFVGAVAGFNQHPQPQHHHDDGMEAFDDMGIAAAAVAAAADRLAAPNSAHGASGSGSNGNSRRNSLAFSLRNLRTDVDLRGGGAAAAPADEGDAWEDEVMAMGTDDAAAAPATGFGGVSSSPGSGPALDFGRDKHDSGIAVSEWSFGRNSNTPDDADLDSSMDATQDHSMLADGAIMSSPFSEGSVAFTCSPASSCRSPSAYGDEYMPYIWILPDELLLVMLSMLKIQDLCSVMQACRKLHGLAMSRSVLAKTSFVSSWPCIQTQAVYTRAATAGNFEATIKLGIASLYGEGVPASAETAGEMLSSAEQITNSVQPFVWLLFRPPWSSDTCSKACIFRAMRDSAEELVAKNGKKSSGLMFCVAKTLALQPSEESKQLAAQWFDRAAKSGCSDAAAELARLMIAKNPSDSGQLLEALRLLRTYAQTGSYGVQMSLCEQYTQMNFGGASQQEAIGALRRVIAQTSAACPVFSLEQDELDKNGKMRYILVDWLVEVADLKLFSRDSLYMTISLVDRYLQRCPITRKTLQLLGIACMVVAARYVEDEVITIREAAWLTDNTYFYEQVVRTMGQALYATGGTLRQPTHLDFVRLYANLLRLDEYTAEMFHYLAELTLLYIPIGLLAPAEHAAAVYFLTALSLEHTQCWPSTLERWTGFSVTHLVPTITFLYSSTFSLKSVKDHRGVELSAVNDRYNRRLNGRALVTLPQQAELVAYLGRFVPPEPEAACADMEGQAAGPARPNSRTPRALTAITNLAPNRNSARKGWARVPDSGAATPSTNAAFNFLDHHS